MITLIAARDKHGAIGKDGTMPWDIKEDLRAFQRETRGGAVIMGRKTWDSLNRKPLPNRCNIVVTSKDVVGDALAVKTVQDALKAASDNGYFRIYGIGGEGIYRDLLPYADRMLITDVDLDVLGADTFFPPVEMRFWHKLNDLLIRHSYPRCIVKEYIRKTI
jgi:dihydrofolate reductase